jgi:hypothetical protein
MTNTNNTAIVPAASTAPSVQLTALERYGRSGGNLYGELLKFSGKTGTWTSGAQGVEVSIGTQLVAIVSELVAGSARSYKHADRKRGTIYNPTLDGVDWVPASAVLDKNNDASTASSSFEDHRPEKQRKRRKASL